MGVLCDALDTPEILEHVLLKLDLKTLLISAQRVCRSWHELIEASPSLQYHLFLRPAPNSAAKAVNPLLAEKFPHWFPSSVGEGDVSSMVFEPEDLETYELVQEDCMAAFKHDRATWRRMLPRQPPIWSFDRYRFTSSMGGTSVDVTRLSETGVSESLANSDSERGADNEQKVLNPNPVSMESLYHFITGGHGDCHTWLFAWGGKVSNNPLPPEIDGHEISGNIKEKIENSIRHDCLVLLECGTVQCTGSGPWKFKRKFAVRGRSCDAPRYRTMKLIDPDNPDAEPEEHDLYNPNYNSDLG